MAIRAVPVYVSMGVISRQNLILTVAVLAVLATMAFFMANVVMPSEAHFVSGINVILFSIPVFWASVMWLGRSDAILLFIIFGVLALLIETSAIITGFPYGHFGYSGLLGYKLFGYTPWTVALAWTPLVLAIYAVVRRTVGSVILRIILIAIFLVVFDLVIDPGAVKIGFWRYEGGGPFHGVPVSNFVGWVFSGTIAGVVMEIFAAVRKPLLPAPVQLIISAFFLLAYWTALAFFSGFTAPTLIGVGILISLAVFYAKYHYAFDDMIVMVDENNNAIGTERKLPAHNAETKLHQAFSVFLFNEKGELLLQQRALTKKTWPGVWSNSCCGHVMLHETVENAAKRRLKYELGVTGVELTVVLPDFRYRAEKDGVVENEICPVLVCFFSGQPHPNPAEVNDIRWVFWDEFIKNVSDPANGYSPWAVEEVELLVKDPKLANFLSASIAENIDIL